MSGTDARRGFRYQDFYLLARILPEVRDILRKVWCLGGNEILFALTESSIRFGIEAKAHLPQFRSSLTAPWDVTVLGTESDEIVEAKSGSVSREDRKVFWRRLRRTMVDREVHCKPLVPLFVVDPDAEKSLDKWQTLGALSENFTGDVPEQEPQTPVRTGAQLLQEAIYFLCHRDADSSAPPLLIDEARTLLGRFQLHPRQFAQLISDVSQHLEFVFPDTPTEMLAGQLRDWLDRRASSRDESLKRFSIYDVIRELNFIKQSARLDSGTWQRWQENRKEWRTMTEGSTAGRLGAGGDIIQLEKAQPAIANRLFTEAAGSQLLLGAAGSGKTTLLVMLTKNITSNQIPPWLVRADNLKESEIDDLANAVRFSAELAEPGQPLWLLVDGLDEVDSARRERWGQVLVRLATHSTVRILATMRDGDWNRDEILPKHLGFWPKSPVGEWPEQLVHGLLDATPFGPHVSPQLFSLLRLPLTLDLFWRTYVEAGVETVGAIPLPISRHQILAQFWERRLVKSPRGASLDRPACFDAIFAAASRALDGFADTHLDSRAVGALASESVIVKVGKLRPKWKFRHPLLRDFAFGQWCLAAGEPPAIVQRWLQIAGAIPQQGALRAILEAVTASDAEHELPCVQFGDLAAAFSEVGGKAQNALILAFGGLLACDLADPAKWPVAIQRRFSPNFGRELIGSVRRSRNLSWAGIFAGWPDSALWLDDIFAEEITQYLSLFRGQKTQNPANNDIHQKGQLLARSVLRWAESPRFKTAFEWQKYHTLLTIADLLPEPATLEWLMRQVADLAQHGHSALLESLRQLAPVDPAKVALLYRKAVGLGCQNGRRLLDPERWTRNIEHSALDRCLFGIGAANSLVCEFPAEFLPVAVEMAEALYWRARQQRLEKTTPGSFLEKCESLFPHSIIKSKGMEAQADSLAEMIDDIPVWVSLEYGEAKCREGIRECAQYALEMNAEKFAAEFAPILRSSRLASIHAVLLELATNEAASSTTQGLLARSLLDQRLFHVPGLLMKLHAALPVAWPNLSNDQRQVLMMNLKTCMKSTYLHTGFRVYRSLLATLPADALDPEQRTEVKIHRAETANASSLPAKQESYENLSNRTNIVEFIDSEIGEWPAVFARERLKHFRDVGLRLGEAKTKEDICLLAKEAQAMAGDFLPALVADSNILEDSSRHWFWNTLKTALEKPRETEALFEADQTALSLSAKLALMRLESGPTASKASTVHIDNTLINSAWGQALDVANEAFIHPLFKKSPVVINSFGLAVAVAWNLGIAPLQAEILRKVTFLRYWRDSQPLRGLVAGPLWEKTSNADIICLALEIIYRQPDVEIEDAVRLILNRADLHNIDNLARALGERLGGSAMDVFCGNQRSGLLPLIDSILLTPKEFPFLVSDRARRLFVCRFAFGMKEQLQKRAENAFLAPDFLRWNISAWEHLRQLPQAPHEDTSDIALFALGWGKREKPELSDKMRLCWWSSLRPLRDLITTKGRAMDVFHLFFQFTDKRLLLDIIGPKELFELVDTVPAAF